jgi:hypothetical protein
LGQTLVDDYPFHPAEVAAMAEDEVGEFGLAPAGGRRGGSGRARLVGRGSRGRIGSMTTGRGPG